MTGSQHAQYQNPETEAAKWHSAIINFIIYTCAFPTVARQTPVKTGLLETVDAARKSLGLFPGCRLRCENFSNSTKTGALHILTSFLQKPSTCDAAATVSEANFKF